MKRMGQYGKQNPLFMYQGTEGLTIRASAAFGASVQADSAEATLSGGALCASRIPAPPFRATQGISVAAPLLYRGMDAADAFAGTPSQSGAARCGA